MTWRRCPRPIGDPPDGRLAVPPLLDGTARAWDDQHAALRAAAGRVADAGTGGFTPAVADAARELVATWAWLVGDAATTAAGHADGLRSASADYRVTDAAVAADHRGAAAAPWP